MGDRANIAENNQTPLVRFRGFAGAWAEQRLGDYVCVSSASRVHRKDWRTDGVPFFRSSDVISAYKGKENDKAYISTALYEELAAASGKVSKGDLLVTGGGSVGVPYVVKDNCPIYFKDADVLWLKSAAVFDSTFLYTFFESKVFRKYLASISHTGTIAHYTIEQCKGTPVSFPSAAEQSLIGKLFEYLDSLISLQRNELKKLRQIKCAMLDKMFPKPGADAPEIRFPGCQSEWEERELGSLASSSFGGGTPASHLEENWNGTLPWFQSSDLSEGAISGVTPRRFISNHGLGNSAARIIPGQSLAIVVRVGVGKVAYVPFPYATSQDFVSLSGLEPDHMFLAYAVYRRLQSDLNAVQGTAIKGITKDELLSKKVMIPIAPDEQAKIGGFFERLDVLISLQVRKGEKLAQVKRSLLSKMFV